MKIINNIEFAVYSKYINGKEGVCFSAFHTLEEAIKEAIEYTKMDIENQNQDFYYTIRICDNVEKTETEIIQFLVKGGNIEIDKI